MALKPLFDRLYIIPIEPVLEVGNLIHVPDTYDKVFEDPQAGTRFVIPQTTRRRPSQGIVKYRGPLTTGEVLCGHHVVFNPLDGLEVLHATEGRLIVIAEEDAAAVIVDEEDNTYFVRHDIKRIIKMLARDIAQKVDTEEEKKAALRIGAEFEERLDAHFAEELFF